MMVMATVIRFVMTKTACGYVIFSYIIKVIHTEIISATAFSLHKVSANPQMLPV